MTETVCTHGWVPIKSGREFQTVGPATEKARQP